MSAFACRLWPETPTTGLCCESSAYGGPEACVCWEPVYDLDQTEPILGIAPDVKPRMCEDCAYRPGSPENTNDPETLGNVAYLTALVETGTRFWCHQGIRRPRVWRHPSGVEVPGSPHAYEPPGVDGVPYKADGTPADLCSGWVALRLKYLQRQP